MRKLLVVGLLAWPVLALLISFNFTIGTLGSALLFYGVPSLAISLYRPSLIKRSLAVAVISIPLMVIMDYVAESTGAWFVSHSVFPVKLFGYVTLEGLIWMFLLVYFIVSLYRCFFDKRNVKTFKSRYGYKKVVIFCLVLLAVFIGVLYTAPNLLSIPYWYLVFGIVFLLSPIFYEILHHPHVLPKLFKTTLYFFYLNFTYEIAALKFGWWSFPGQQFIGQVTVFGASFPLEELFFWVILFAMSILSYYEYVFDDEK